MNAPSDEPAPGVGRPLCSERDVVLLASDERALAVIAYQRARYPHNIKRTSELLALWTRKIETDDDYDGDIYLPSKTGLTYSAFVDAWRELFRRVESGIVLIPADILSRFPDIDSYVPRE